MSDMTAWKAEQARKNADLTYSMCENHDAAGACDAECLMLVKMMAGDDYSEPMIYSDYRGGTSSVDVSGCHAPAPRAEEMPMLDTERRRIYYVTVHEWYTAEHGEVAAYKAEETADTVTLVATWNGWTSEIKAGDRLTVAKATTEQLTKEPR